MILQLRSFARPCRIREKLVRERIRQRLAHEHRSDTAPESSRTLFGTARAGFWTGFGRFWRAPAAPTLFRGRLLGVPGRSQARPGASPKQFWAPKAARERLVIDVSSILLDFSVISGLFFVALCLTFVRLSRCAFCFFLARSLPGAHRDQPILSAERPCYGEATTCRPRLLP